MTPQERATLDLYGQAARELPLPLWSASGPQPHIASVDASPKAIALALVASRGKLYNPAGKPFDGQRSFEWTLSELAHLLVDSAAHLEDAGKLDAALDHYLAAIRVSIHLRDWQANPFTDFMYHEFERGADQTEIAVYARLPLWAARPGQTPERILAAARQLEQLTSDISPTSGVKLVCYRIQRFLSGGLSTTTDTGEYVPALTMLWMHLPWERARALRLLNLLTHHQFTELLQAQRAAQDGKKIVQPSNWFPPLKSDYHWYTAMESPYALRTQIQIPPIAYDATWDEVKLVRDYTATVTSRRAVRLLLALEAWKLQHGSLPETLDELVGPCLDRLPVDPYTGRPFRYFRDGLKIPLRWNQPHTRLPWEPDYLGGTIAPSVPFIWAAGARVSYEWPATKKVRDGSDEDNVFDEYRLYTDMDRRSGFRRPNSAYDVWEAGWPFPIP